MEVVDIQNDVGVFATALWTWAVEFLPRFFSAILILALGWIAAGWASRAVQNLIAKSDRVDTTLRPFFGGVVRYAVLILVFVAFLSQLGVQTTSILAALGAAGLAIGLALQGTLSNIAAGIMLIWLRPFGVGDYVETSDFAGTVEQVGLFHTQIRTWDGVYKFIPNSQLWNVPLTNYSRNPSRMVIIEFGVSYDADVAEARAILVKTAENNAQVAKDPAPVVVPLSLGDSAVVLQMRAWAPTTDFWNIRWDLTQTGKKDLEAAGIEIPFPQRVVHMVAPDGGPKALPPSAID